MEKSNCFIIANNIYIIAGRHRGESLNKWNSKYEWYYTIVNITNGNRIKLTDEGFKNMSEQYKIEWKKSVSDMRNIKIINK